MDFEASSVTRCYLVTDFLFDLAAADASKKVDPDYTTKAYSGIIVYCFTALEMEDNPYFKGPSSDKQTMVGDI